MPIQKSARYAGTQMADKWYKIYKKDLFWVRGNGKIWLGDDRIHFLRIGLKKEILIPCKSIKDIKFGYWHCRGWQIWLTIKVIWEREGQLLSTGFVVSRHKEATKEFANLIRKKIIKYN